MQIVFIGVYCPTNSNSTIQLSTGSTMARMTAIKDTVNNKRMVSFVLPSDMVRLDIAYNSVAYQVISKATFEVVFDLVGGEKISIQLQPISGSPILSTHNIVESIFTSSEKAKTNSAFLNVQSLEEALKILVDMANNI